MMGVSLAVVPISGGALHQLGDWNLVGDPPGVSSQLQDGVGRLLSRWNVGADAPEDQVLAVLAKGVIPCHFWRPRRGALGVHDG